MNDTSFIKENMKKYLEKVLTFLNHTNKNYSNDIDEIFDIVQSFSDVLPY
jgi:hypothetical protein